MNSLIHGVSPALLAQILAELGARYSWAFNSEPVCIVARMLQREIEDHRVTRAALQVVQDTKRTGLGAQDSGLGGETPRTDREVYTVRACDIGFQVVNPALCRQLERELTQCSGLGTQSSRYGPAPEDPH